MPFPQYQGAFLDDPAQLSRVTSVVSGSNHAKLAGEKGNAVKGEIRREHQQGNGDSESKNSSFSRN